MIEKIQWSDEYLLNIPEIDEQHKKLLSYANNLYEIVVGSKEEFKNKMTSVLKDLTEYTQYHFENEEKFMADNDYYGIDVHKLAHDGFILEVKKQINQINDEDVESAEKFYIFVTKWVLTHIAKADKVWANFIKEKK
ncbi:MAG: hemerythrin family protein [Treponema sp.]|nr:hemerythrin family protein [Treponema sp.]